MPIPKPEKNEEQDDFIGRCIPLVLEREDLDKDDEDDRKQATAICFNSWRGAKETKAMKKKAEEQSLEDQLAVMRLAFDKAFNKTAQEPTQPVSYAWIEKTLDDHVIAERDGKFYKIPFSTDEGGEITFGEPEEVEKIERYMVAKAEQSRDKQLRMIRQAFDQAFNQRPPMPETRVTGGLEMWIKEIFEDYVIARQGTQLFKIPFEIDKEDKITFGDIQEVETQYIAVKAVEEGEDWIIEGWGAPFGGPDDGKDSDGEYFSVKTDFALPMFPSRPVIFHHGMTEDDPGVIGQEASVEAKDGGLWVRVVLDKTKELAKKAWELAKKGKLFFSSGAISHLVRKAKEGLLTKWPVCEWSLTPNPVNKYAVAFTAAKARFAEIGVELADTHGPEAHQGGGDEAPPGDVAAKAEAGETPTVNQQISTKTQEVTTMEIREQLEAILAEREEAARIKAEAEELVALRDEVKAQKTRLDEIEADKERKIKHPTSSGIEVKGTVWDQMDPEDRELVGMLMAKQGRALSEDLMRAIKGGLEENMPKYKAFLDEAEIKAIALMDKTDTANWVPANYEARIWDRLRVENRVASLFRQINMPTDNYYLPVATAGPTVYVVPEQTAGTPTLATGITTSQVTDAKVTLASSKIGSAVWFSGEMDEDGVLPMLPIVRDQIGKAIDEAVEYVLLNGDQTTGGANITDTSAGTTSLCVAQDGLRHFGLVDATGFSANLGTLTAADFITLRSTMGIYGLNPEDIAYLCDYNTIYKAWDIDEVATLDKFGPNAVILKGQTAAVYGSPLIASGQMNKFGTDGKYHATPTKGIVIAVHRPSWIIGWRRRIKFGVNYFDNVDATRVTSLLRMAFEPFGTSLGHACVGYNVGV